MAARPNILLFMPDQLRADAVGAFGCPMPTTPNVDALASDGTRFSQAFSQHSVCGPSRVSMFTGWYPHVHGHRTLDNLIKPWEPNVFRRLREAGYFVAQAGPRGDTMAPGVTTASFDWHGLLEKPTYRAAAPDSGRAISPGLADAFYRGRRPRTDGQRFVLDFDEAAVRTAEQLLAEGLPEPWLLFVPLVFPHPPFTVEDPWFARFDRATIPLPLPPRLEGEPRFMQQLRDAYGLARLGDDEWQELRAVYFGMVNRVDEQFGRVLAAVERTTAIDDTAVFFLTDHGEYLGDFGLIEKWPSGLDQCLLRDPLVVRIPGYAGGRTADGMVEMVDLTPTLLELAEVEPGYTQFGRSLLPLLKDPTATHRAAVFSEGGHRIDEPHVIEQAPPPYDIKASVQQADARTIGKAVAVRTDRWTFVHRSHDNDELYDRMSDPEETRNQSGQIAVAEIEQALRTLVLDWLLETCDVVPDDADPRWVGKDEMSPPRIPSSASAADLARLDESTVP